MPALIRSVHGALSALGQPAAPEVSAEPLEPAVPVRRSVTEDRIIGLEDGRKLKFMKRSLAGLGMTPAEYRARRNRPADHSVVAPAYARQRSEPARSLGLGRKAAAAPEPAPAPSPARTRSTGDQARAKKGGPNRAESGSTGGRIRDDGESASPG